MDDDLHWHLRLTYFIVAPPVVLVIFTTNIFILILIFRNNKLRSRCNVGVASWAVCDIIIGLVLFAQLIFMGIRSLTTDYPKDRRLLLSDEARDILNEYAAETDEFVGSSADDGLVAAARTGNLYLCVFWASIQLVPILVSCLHWVCLAIERYVAIMDAVHYEQRLTCKRIKTGLILVWSYAILWSIVPFAWHGDTTSRYGDQYCNLCVILARYYILLLVLLHFLPCLLATVAIFARIFMHVRAHQRQVHVTHTMTQDKLLKDFTLARSFLIVFLLSVIFWSPFFISALIGVANDFPTYLQTTASACMLVGMVASVVKLPIYVLTSKDFGKAFKDMFTKPPQPPSRHRY